jgi:hypothetical protein
MKDAYKNPLLYYIAIPATIALWPLLVWAVYLPNAKASFEADQEFYGQAQDIFNKIHQVEPERLQQGKGDKGPVEFDYATAVDEAAAYCKISANHYELFSKPATTSRGSKIQTCRVSLTDIGIEAFAKFLSKIQLQWPSLECSKVTFKAQKGKKDIWKVDLDFKYEF